MPQSLTGQGFRGWRFVCPNATHATQTPPKRHPLVASTDRAGSLIEPAPSLPMATTATVYLPSLLKSLLSEVTMGTLQ